MKIEELKNLILNEQLVNQNDLKTDLEQLLSYNNLKQDSDIISFNLNSSLDTYKYLLENGLNPNTFLKEILNTHCSSSAKDKKNSLIELAFSYKADPNTLTYIYYPEEYLDQLILNGLTLNNALKFALSFSMTEYDSLKDTFIENAEKINFRDKTAIDLINKGANLAELIKDISLHQIFNFLTSQRDFVFSHPNNSLSTNDYLKIIFYSSNPSEQHKIMLEDAFARGANPKIISTTEIPINLNQLIYFKEILLKHITPNNLLELLALTYANDAERLESTNSLIIDLINQGANFNNLFKKSTSFNNDINYFITTHEEFLLSHPINPFTPDNYLKAALNIIITDDNGIVEQSKLELQSTMLERAIALGANVNKVIDTINSLNLEVLNFNKDLIVKHLGASYLLIWSLNLPNSEYNSFHGRIKNEEELKSQSQLALELVKFAITNGADINFNLAGMTALDLATDREIITLLKSHGAESANTQIKEFYQNGLQHLILQPERIFDKKYKNLNAQESKEAKIPYLMHHIWLTHKNNPQEIRPQDLENVIRTKEIFTKSNASWTHIVWTNDKTLIPESIKKLTSYNIEVRSIYDYKEEIASIDIITDSISQQKWGKSSDQLRESLIEEFGGWYADVNYIFSRDITSESHKYNFFSQTYGEYYIDNFFFGASPHHPVVQKMVELTARNLVNPPEYLTNIQNQDSRIITDMATANPTFIAYYLEANKYGNIDLIYPITNKEAWDRDSNKEQETEDQIREYLDLEALKGNSDQLFDQFMLYVHNHEICGAEDLYIGHDSTDGLTWI